MIIIHGSVYTPEFRFEKKVISVRDGRFLGVYDAEGENGTEAGSASGPRSDGLSCDVQNGPAARAATAPNSDGRSFDEEVIDASGCYVIPGLIDIHFHGCMGADICDNTPEAVRTLARYEASQGVTAICPATLTLPVETLRSVLSMAADYAEGRHGPHEADLVGINMEGPFISRVKKGAQNGDYIIPCDVSVCESFLEASRGLVRIIGLAPEENPDFRSFIASVKSRVRVSLAHTNADYDTAMAAFEEGASHVVHLFNAMSPMSHRAPGVVGALRDSPGVMAELICDGNHVHPAVVRAAFDMLGEERIILISDSLRACGLGDGTMVLGGQEVEVRGTLATLAGTQTLAGSVSSLTRCLQIAVTRMGIAPEKAVRCATYNPARAIGVLDQYGTIEAGKRADCVLIDVNDLSVRQVIKDGVLVP